jgi:hypothetical protein
MRIKPALGAGRPPSQHKTDNIAPVHFELELWRADLCMSVMEVDSDGYVLVPETPEVAQLYPGDLLLGLPAENIVDKHIGALLPPLANRGIKELFTAGAFGPVLPALSAMRKAGAKRTGGMKSSTPGVQNRARRLQCCLYSW